MGVCVLCFVFLLVFIAAAPIGYYTEPSRVVVCCLLFNVTLLFASFVEVRAQPRKLFASHHN